jgi:CMP-N-acetylneuraminic acid synthetase
MKKGILAVIPARGGSKRIPHKNIRLFLDRPIIAYVLDAVQQSGLFDRIVVTTDDPEIARVAERFGGEVPFIRGPDLADDITPVSLATLDALERVDPAGEQFGCIAQMMPNCPLVSPADILDSYHQFTGTGADSQISVTRYAVTNPWWAMTRDDQYRLKPLFEEEIKSRSQDLPELFCPTGVIWWAKADALRREKTFYTKARTGWEIPWERSIDIDTEDDWKMAEVFMKERSGRR